MKKNAVAEALKKASQGLQFPSETDAPFEAFVWEGQPGKPDKARVLALAGLPEGAPVKVKGLDAFFAKVTEEQDWHDEGERGEVRRFRQLVQTLKESLADVKVFQAGEGQSDVYIVGRAE